MTYTYDEIIKGLLTGHGVWGAVRDILKERGVVFPE